MIPLKTKPSGRPARYDWTRLNKVGGWVSGSSRESLLTCAKAYFSRRGKRYSFTTRQESNGTFTIYRKK